MEKSPIEKPTICTWNLFQRLKSILFPCEPPKPTTTTDTTISISKMASGESEIPAPEPPEKVQFKALDLWCHRINADYLDLLENGPWGISAQMMPHDYTIWTIEIMGPLGSLYEGGVFRGILQFHELYPYAPPTFHFLCPMFHPNISPEGEPCLDQIHRVWTPCQTIWSLLASIQFVLGEPNPFEPVNDTAAMILRVNPELYEEMVKDCVQKSVELVTQMDLEYKEEFHIFKRGPDLDEDESLCLDVQNLFASLD